MGPPVHCSGAASRPLLQDRERVSRVLAHGPGTKVGFRLAQLGLSSLVTRVPGELAVK